MINNVKLIMLMITGEMCMLRLKKISEVPRVEDGFRILIDESWPEGLTREEAKVDLWLREISPPPEIDEWPGDNPLFNEAVLDQTENLNQIRRNTIIKLIRNTEKEKGTVTFLYSTVGSIKQLPV
jgi:uncharacterized protein YeaO (DUF488 family)